MTYEGAEKLIKDVAVFKKMSDDMVKLAPTQQAFIEDFIRHENGIVETVYSNGMHLFVNLGIAVAETPDGEQIPVGEFRFRLNG